MIGGKSVVQGQCVGVQHLDVEFSMAKSYIGRLETWRVLPIFERSAAPLTLQG